MDKFDPFGEAAYDFHFNNIEGAIDIKIDLAEDEQLPIDYLFRTVNQMPPLERIALQHCSGKVLDIGSGAGSHAIALQAKGLAVTAIDISPKLCAVARGRGVIDCTAADIFEYESDCKFDTITLLMNGIGIAGSLSNFTKLLLKLKDLLAPKGKILFDSSDIVYLYMNEDGSADINIASDKYYGEIEYTLGYKGEYAPAFSWLFIDKDNMRDLAEEIGFNVNILKEGDHFDYLASLSVK